MAESVPITSSSADEGSEYKAMRECNAMMVELLQFSIGRLGDALFGKGLIPLEVKENLTMVGISEANQTRRVLDCIIQKVKYTPQAFHDFVQALKEQDFQDVADQLLSCYQSQTATSQPSSSLPPTVLQYTLSSQLIRTMMESLRVTSLHEDQNQSVILRVERDTQPQPSKDLQITWNTDPNYAHTAMGSGEILLLMSKVSGNNTVPRRSRTSLTEEEKHKLNAQGIHDDYCHTDLSIMTARYDLDKEFTTAGVLTGEQITCKEVKQRMTELFKTTDKVGVGLHYIGPGEKETGNWCFKDGVISFEEILDLYTQHLKPRGRGLGLIADCSYSGHWVKEAMTFMDGQGVGPCGHQAKEKGILIKVRASCLANEIPAELAFSTHCIQNDKNGTIAYAIDIRNKEIHDNQHPSGLDFTAVRCNNKIDHPCTMAPESTWKQWSDEKRICAVLNENKGQKAWYYLLLEDDEDTIHNFFAQPEEGLVNLTHYGRVINCGRGEDPPKETKKWMRDTYCINYNYQSSPNTTA